MYLYNKFISTMPQAFDMMGYEFNFKGHRNVTALHSTTIEFTKEKELGKEGDCVIGVDADFELDRIREFIKKLKGDKIKIEIMVNGHKEVITGSVNREFNDQKDIVLRKSGHISDRTLVANADKASTEISREMVKRLKNNGRGKVLIFADD